jgi:hypothetical protein
LIQICEGGKRRWSLYYHESGGEATLLHSYHCKDKTIVHI